MKVEVQELRIGNLVMVDNLKYHPQLQGVVLMVTAINPKLNVITEKEDYGIGLVYPNQKPNTYYDSYSQFLKYVEPIRLTEDWLLRMGLPEEHSKLNIFGDYACYFERGKYGLYLIYRNHNEAQEVLFVHEAQNIFYWNSGKTELIIKDKQTKEV